MLSKIDIYFKAPEFNFGGVEPMYDIVSPLRTLLANKKDEKGFFFELESHLDRWRAEEDEQFDENHRRAADYLRRLGFSDTEQVNWVSYKR